MGLFGDLVKMGFGAFPEIPDAPSAPFVDPQNAQRASIQGNLSALGDLQGLGEEVDQYNLRQRTKMLTEGFPQFGAIRDTGSDTLLSQLRGEVPEDVSDAVLRSANARAFAGGFGGSDFGGRLQARDLGRTSFDIQRMGQAAAPSWLGTIAGISVPQQFDVRSGFVSPQDQITSQQWNETNRFNRDWLQNQLDSIPDPETVAIAEGVGGIADMIGTAALAWAGGGIGAGIGGAGGGMMGAQMGGMLGGGGSQSGMDIGSIIGSMWQPTAATTPAPLMGYQSPPMSPTGTRYDPYSLGFYNFGGY